MSKYRLLVLTSLFSLIMGTMAHASDLTQGVMLAMPADKPPTIGDDLSDWDFSASEPIWIAAQTAAQMHGSIAIMYDTDALYLAAKVSLPGRPLHNPNNPVDQFWSGDEVEIRLSSDPTLPNPLPGDKALKASNRICHCSIWKNSITGLDYINIAYGSIFDKGKAVNPAGSKIVITQHGTDSYTVAAKIPWSALNVPGGHNPFHAGDKTEATLSIHWGNGGQTPALFRVNPGDFAFHHPESWGDLIFSPVGHVSPRHGTMEEALAAAKPKPVGVPIEVNIPEDGMKLSVNIIGSNGEVIREIAGGEPEPKGKATVYFDGKDAWGNPLAPGSYTWGAYLSKGLEAKFAGSAGIGGNPPYPTADGKGAWGADHGEPIDVAADKTGRYFLWVLGEAGMPVVKTDFQGKVQWRKNPFVGGGFGPFYAITGNGQNVFISFGKGSPELVRLDAANGQLLTFPGGASTAPISRSQAIEVAPESSPVSMQPETCGLAASSTEVFAPVYSQNIIQVMDPQTGKPTRTLACPAPRGVALDANGNLFAVSFPANGSPTIVKFTAAAGEPVTVVKEGLVAPWHVAVDSQGSLYVSDLGNSQQIKVFSPDGKLQRAMGKAGGRVWSGAYDPSSFLLPSGVAIDSQGDLLTSESSLPKVMSCFKASTGKLLNHWYGTIAYSGLDIPDPTDPWTVYYPVTDEGMVRGIIPHSPTDLANPAELRLGIPDAYWSFGRGDDQGLGNPYGHNTDPNIFLAKNGHRYIYGEGAPHPIYRIDGDKLVPVAHFVGGRQLRIWTDTNGDGKEQPGEVTTLDTIDGQPIPPLASSPGAMYMRDNGDVYLYTLGNKILLIPATGIDSNGIIHWDASKAHIAVPEIFAPWKQHSNGSPREGSAGMRVDSQGNLYTCFNAVAPYATKELTAAMKEGLGHAAGPTAIKITKYAPDGHLLWMAGRKATAAAKPGEMYHMWVLGGLVGDDYITAASEWGQIYVYTKDGFFVDALMNNPGLAPGAGPYTFGGETFGGRVQDFPDLNQVWAYSCGLAYQIQGFDHGQVVGEQRLSGTVLLDKVYETAAEVAVAKTPLQFVAIHDPFSDEKAWTNVSTSTILQSGQPLATMQLGYDSNFLYARAHVADPTPLQNSADNINTAFHGGDAVGLYLGSVLRNGEAPILGDIHILAANVGGKPRLIAMKPMTGLTTHPEQYVTPGGGKTNFSFVGEIPGGKVTLVPDIDGQGYTAMFAVPRTFVELTLTPGTGLCGDAEVLLSGQADRGLQTVSRHYLFTPLNAKTNMIDDVPTEARLYPQYWGEAQIK